MNAEGTQNLINTVMKYVHPELERRNQAGNPISEGIWAAQVIFGSQDQLQVRLNREVRLLARIGGSAEFQDYVELLDASHRQFEAISLPEDEKNIRHLTMCQTGISYSVLFSFSDSEAQIEQVKSSGGSVAADIEMPSHADWQKLLAEHSRVVDRILAFSSPNPERPVEVLMAIAIQRSRHLVEAYVKVIAEKNLTAASALIRMQLDSAMRVNAHSLVSDPNILLGAMQKDEQWGRLKSKDNKDLRDAYLKEKLAEKFNWVTGVYNQMSGYIHLSRPHLESATEGEAFLGMFIYQGSAGERVTNLEVAENAQTFITVTNALLSLCDEYVDSRPSN